MLSKSEFLKFLAARKVQEKAEQEASRRREPRIEEERKECNGELHYNAVASLAADKTNVSFEDITRAD